MYHFHLSRVDELKPITQQMRDCNRVPTIHTGRSVGSEAKMHNSIRDSGAICLYSMEDIVRFPEALLRYTSSNLSINQGEAPSWVLTLGAC